MLALTVAYNGTAADRGLGVVRLHRTALTALGLTPGAPVALAGTRRTGAAVALAPDPAPAGTALLDEVLLRNAGVPEGGQVEVEPVDEVPAGEVTVAAPQELARLVPPELLREALLGKWVTAGDEATLLLRDAAVGGPRDTLTARTRLGNLLGPAMPSSLVRVTGTSPAGPVLVTMGTVVGWDGGATTTGSATPVLPDTAPRAGTSTAGPARTLADLPGLEQPGRLLHEWLNLAFSHPDLLRRLGTTPATGVLLTGPAGSGKCALVEVVASMVGARLHRVWAPSLAALVPDAAARQLRDLLAGAARSAPGVVLVEDVEALAPRDGGPLLTVLLPAVRDAVRDGRVAVVCTTAHPEQVSPQLRAPGTLDHELALPLPDRGQRLRQLEAATRSVPLADDVRLDELAARTPGFVAADLLALVREAGLRAAARVRGTQETPAVGQVDLLGALEVVHPTAMEGAPLDLGDTTLDDVGDMAETKAALTEAVLWPLQYPETFARLGVEPPRGVLLYGPPGCGKTFLVQALAGSGQANVLSVKGAELLSKWVGESERAVRELFRRAREAAPALVFLDEVDALAPVRGQSTDGGTTDRVVAALLTELDGVEPLQDVTVVAATNRPDLVDPALLRPGRLERLVYVPPPDAAARTAILHAAARAVPLAPDVDLDALGPRTEGFSAADCAALVREAALTAMRESTAATTVTAAHVEAALAAVRPSLDPAQVAALAAYAGRRAQPMTTPGRR